MRPLITLLILLLVPASQPGAFAFQSEKPVTPYGDFCSRIGHYGAYKKIHDLAKVEHALRHYFHKKGLRIEIESIHGRFIKAVVKKKGDIVDVVLFDSRTGRIRSIY